MENAKGNRKYLYFVDAIKFEVDDSTITGASIKVKLPEEKRSYALYLEGHGNDPDQLINDDSSISLEQGAKHFYTVPPASFGVK
jgi:hypothetical protein